MHLPQFIILYSIIFLAFMILYVKVHREFKLAAEKNELNKIMEENKIEAENHSELSELLKSMSLSDLIDFRKDFIDRYNLGNFSDRYEVDRSDLFQRLQFQEFMDKHNFKFTEEINLKTKNKSQSHKSISRIEYKKIMNQIDKTEDKYPDNSLDKLSGKFRLGY